MNWRTFVNIALGLLLGMLLGLHYRQQSDIIGLTTRVNLLEARIHWQEEPPK